MLDKQKNTIFVSKYKDLNLTIMEQVLQRIIALLVGVFTCGAMTAQTDYGIEIAGTDLTSANASAINHDNFPNFDFNGTITYDHATKTFILDNFLSNVYTDGGFIRISDDAETAEYKIKLVGSNAVTVNGYIETYKNLTIEGDGTLKVNLEGGAAILVQDNSTLTIKNTNVRAIGTWGIAGFNGRKGEKLVIKNSTVRATSTGEGGSIMDLQDITLDGCRITSPAGAAVAVNGTRGKAVMKDGEVVTEEVEILPTGTGIDAPRAEPLAVYPNPASDFVTIETDVLGSAITIVDLSGRVVMTATAADTKNTLNVSSLPTGTYIVRAANRVTKIIKM